MPFSAPAALNPASRKTLPKADRSGRIALFGFALAGLTAFWALGVGPASMTPGPRGLELLGEFFASALSPALAYQSDFAPPGAPPLLLQAFMGALASLFYAAAALSLAFVFAVPLALAAAESSGRSGGLLRTAARAIAAGLRSVHELLWAVLLMAAVGFSPLTAIIALALPYMGTLAKIYGEILDETDAAPAKTIVAAGGGRAAALLCGRVPRAFPDLLSFTLYQYECAVRSSAVMGFFGIPTLGFYIVQANENLHYGEVWTYLYATIALMGGLELWGRALRRRLAQ